MGTLRMAQQATNGTAVKTKPEFDILINPDEMTYGDYLDMTSGDPREQAQCLARYVGVDGVLVGPERGLKLLRALKLSELEQVMTGVTQRLTGETDPN